MTKDGGRNNYYKCYYLDLLIRKRLSAVERGPCTVAVMNIFSRYFTCGTRPRDWDCTVLFQVRIFANVQNRVNKDKHHPSNVFGFIFFRSKSCQNTSFQHNNDLLLVFIDICHKIYTSYEEEKYA